MLYIISDDPLPFLMGLGLPAVDVMCHHSSADVSCAGRNGAQEHQRVLPAGSMELVRKHQNEQPFFSKEKKNHSGALEE